MKFWALRKLLILSNWFNPSYFELGTSWILGILFPQVEKMYSLEKKFKTLNKELEWIRQKININEKKIEDQAETLFQASLISSRIRAQQQELVNKINHDMASVINLSDRFFYRGNSDTSLSSDVPLRLYIKNELSMYKKLEYWHLYNEHYSPLIYSDIYSSRSDFQIYMITYSDKLDPSYLILDRVNQALNLADKKFNTFKQIKIRPNYLAKVCLLAGSKILCLLYTENYSHIYLCLFDQNLKLDNWLSFKKLLDFTFEWFESVDVHQIEAGNFVLKFTLNNSGMHKYFVFDLSLNLVKRSETTNLKANGTDFYLPSREVFIFKRASKIYQLAVLKNKVKETKSIISLIDSNFNLLMDAQQYIYVFKSFVKKNQILVYCYDLNGRLVFKNTIVSDDFSSFASLYTFDNKLYIASTFRVIAIIWNLETLSEIFSKIQSWSSAIKYTPSIPVFYI